MYIKNKANNGSKFAPLPKKNPHRDHEKNKKGGFYTKHLPVIFFICSQKHAICP